MTFFFLLSVQCAQAKVYRHRASGFRTAGLERAEVKKSGKADVNGTDCRFHLQAFNLTMCCLKTITDRNQV
jgi:hypothetical protein